MKKKVKISSTFLLTQLLIIMCFFLCEASAVEEAYTYDVISSGCMITKYNGKTDSEIRIPDSIDGYVVTAIGEKAFSGVKTVSKITLPETVKSIYDEAFINCSNLTEFTMPDSVTYVGEAVFSGCINLKEAVFSDNIKIIPGDTFYNCVSLSDVKLSDEAYIISSKAFFSCSSLKQFILPKSTRVIANEVFFGCDSLVSVYMPSSIESIGKDAFNECTQLQSVYYEGTSALNESFSVSSGNESLIKAVWSYEHKHNAISLVEKISSTCVSDGYTEAACICGFTQITDFVPASGHNLSVLQTVKAPSCNQKGLARVFCSECDYFEEMLLPETSHKTVIDAAVPADCITSGKTQGSHCYVCGAVIVAQNAIKPLGHDFTSKIIDKEHLVLSPTYSSPASYRYSCSRCSEIGSETFLAGEKLLLGRPSDMAFASNEGAIKLAWTEVSDADFYGLFYKDAKGIWKLYRKLYGTTCLISGLPAGASYTFGVKAYIEEKGVLIASPYYIELKAATQALKPSKVVSEQNDKAIKLTWTASKGATGYRIYGYDAYAKSWVVVVSNTTKCSAVVNNLKSGTSYLLAVRPYINTGTKIVWSSNYTTIIAATKPLSPVLKATSLKGGVRFNWDKVNGADGYAVYGSTNPNSGYVLLSLSTALTYTKTGLESGRTYYFKAFSVKVVNGKYLLSNVSDTKPVKTR